MQIETNQTPRTTCLTTQEAADYLRFSERTLIRWRNVGEGPTYIRAGGKILYRRSDLSEYLEGNRVVPVRVEVQA